MAVEHFHIEYHLRGARRPGDPSGAWRWRADAEREAESRNAEERAWHADHAKFLVKRHARALIATLRDGADDDAPLQEINRAIALHNSRHFEWAVRDCDIPEDVCLGFNVPEETLA